LKKISPDGNYINLLGTSKEKQSTNQNNAVTMRDEHIWSLIANSMQKPIEGEAVS
jgi:hypothetical protein